jgi:hypothetical protein
MAPHTENKYSVNARIAALTTQVTELQSALKALRVVLFADLQNYLDAHCHGQNGADGRDGVDGAPGATGPQGPAGDITVYGPDELQAAVKAARTELVQQRAKFQAALFQALADANGPHAANWRRRLEDLKRMAGI